MEGWINLHILNNPIWINSTAEQKVILITILLLANHEPYEWEWKGEKITINNGQFITTLESIVSKCGKGVTVQNARTALSRFEKLEFLTNESTKTGRLITVANWEFCQGESKKLTNNLTDNQQTTNKQITNDQQTNNNESVVTKPKKSTRFIPPTPEEVQQYCIERCNGINAQNFIDFYNAKGWMVGKNKMKDWKAAVRTWENRNKQSAPVLNQSRYSEDDLPF